MSRNTANQPKAIVSRPAAPVFRASGSGSESDQPVAPPTSLVAPDCRLYRGDKPCQHNRVCRGCTHYQPFAQRVCVIKLGALGDVVRTLCILPELRRRYPNAQVTWVSLTNGVRMLQGQPGIDRVLPFDAVNSHVLMQERFDLLISLDKEAEPCALAMAIHADVKLGVGLSPFGNPIPLNPQAEDFFALGLSDEMKFRRNQSSYPRLVYGALGWDYHGQRYELEVNPQDRLAVRERLAAAGWDESRTTLGVNVGAGKVFANKMWPAERVAETIRLIRADQPGLQMLLLGGPDERPAVDAILADLSRDGSNHDVFDAGTDHREGAFVAVVDACDVLFSGDTMAMHAAIARGKSVVAFFGPTCEQEIDLFGRGEKLVASVACGPCYKRRCDHANACIDAVAPREAADAVSRVLDRNRENTRTFPLPLAPTRRAG
ncbi:MAG: glycosyltransferase family 9 protein [Planctomycetota bacterium]|nr:glycosyltransferase family 9 protein [Planctomycetota bacterium]